MPNYKKRKHNKLFTSQGKPKKNSVKKAEKFDNIEMSSSRNKRVENKSNNIKVIKGRKLEQKRRFKVLSITLALVLVIYILLQSLLPAGIFETVTNKLSLIGTGSYPITLESTNTINVVPRDSYYYVLTNSFVCAYSNSGKQLFTYPHGFENPVIETSSSRAVVFNQGGNQVLIFNHSGHKGTINTEQKIITVGISDSGIYAVATYSEKYASAVTVYNKRNETLYEWYSAEETVNNVALSPNGKKLAVSGFTSNVGEYKSTLNVLNYKSATPEHTEKFDGSLIYNIDTTHRAGFTVITPNKLKIFKWSNFKSQEHTSDYKISFFKPSSNGAVAVFNRENDKTDNKILVLNKNGKLKFQVQYKGIISDINLFGNHIYCMNETEISVLNSDGHIVKKAPCGFGADDFTVISTNVSAVITDNKIEKVKLGEVSNK